MATQWHDSHDGTQHGPPQRRSETIVVLHPPVQKWSPGLAAVFSFFIPGLGQLYK